MDLSIGETYAMERASLVSKARLTSAKLTEVLGSLGDNIGTEFHDDAASGLAANGDIKKDLGVGPGMQLHCEMYSYVRNDRLWRILQRLTFSAYREKTGSCDRDTVNNGKLQTYMVISICSTMGIVIMTVDLVIHMCIWIVA
jgi:hypothetical protein